MDLTERNANHNIPSYCHLPVSCRSLVDRYINNINLQEQFRIILFKKKAHSDENYKNNDNLWTFRPIMYQ